MTRALPRLTANHADLDLADDKFGFLESSSHLIDNPTALRERMAAEGYLYMPGLLDRDLVLDARRVCAERLAEKDLLDPRYDLMDCVAREGASTAFMPELTKGNAPLMRVLYDGAMIRFYEALIGGPVLHFDYTWFRAVSPGRGTQAHMDVVYMGRGTKRLFTSWTPIGDVPLEQGGLIVLEKSHLHDRLNQGYGSKDVDKFCENRRDADYKDMGGGGNIQAGGVLSKNAVKLRNRLGGRWLTADYRAGDLLAFSVFTVHASLDNHSNRIRLSSDSRYQSAAEPADHRWMGQNPIAHGPQAKQGMIC